MHYYSVFKDQPFWGERKQYSLNPVRVNGSVRILRRSFHRQRAERRPKGSLRTSVPEVKPLAEGKSAPGALLPAPTCVNYLSGGAPRAACGSFSSESSQTR